MSEWMVLVCRKSIILIINDLTQIYDSSEDVVESQKIDNFGNEINWLAASSDNTLIVYTSSGNFHVYEFSTELKHITSYVNQNDAISGLLEKERKKTIEFENEKLREVSAMQIFGELLIVTYWDSDKIDNSKCIEFLNIHNLNEIVCKYCIRRCPAPMWIWKNHGLWKFFNKKIYCKKLYHWTYWELDLLFFLFSYLNTMQ